MNMRNLPHLFCIMMAFYFAFKAVMAAIGGFGVQPILFWVALAVVCVWLAGIPSPIRWFYRGNRGSSNNRPSFGGR